MFHDRSSWIIMINGKVRFNHPKKFLYTLIPRDVDGEVDLGKTKLIGQIFCIVVLVSDSDSMEASFHERNMHPLTSNQQNLIFLLRSWKPHFMTIFICFHCTFMDLPWKHLRNDSRHVWAVYIYIYILFVSDLFNFVDSFLPLATAMVLRQFRNKRILLWYWVYANLLTRMMLNPFCMLYQVSSLR